MTESGHRGALDVLGYDSPKLTLDRFDVVSETVSLGGALEFEVEITSTAKADQRLIIDYVVHHMRANGNSKPKVFKWKTATLKAGATTNRQEEASHQCNHHATQLCRAPPGGAVSEWEVFWWRRLFFLMTE